jgi:hypothetical protein
VPTLARLLPRFLAFLLFTAATASAAQVPTSATSVQGEQRSVPRVIGMPLAEAQAALNAVGI